MSVLLERMLERPVEKAQCRIQCVGADRQAQQDSHTEIHQLYHINRANSRHINNNKARKLKFGMQLDKCHIRKQLSHLEHLK